MLAARLSEDGKNTVLVLEYGGTDIGPLIQMPSALSFPMNMKTYNWGYESEPEPHLGGRRLVTPRGKVIGGSSSINGMVYVRGHARDFDTWEQLGAKGWGFRHVLPYYQRLEARCTGDDGWRGRKGPMHITRGTMKNPLYRAFVNAACEAGYPYTADYNGRRQEGACEFDRTIWQGTRWSAANAYLTPARKRANLNMITRALATRIILDGKRATGVEYVRGGKTTTASARREVIIAASAINSPKLLQQSGIGNADHLRAAGIKPRHHLPGTGENLQDHLEVYVQMECLQPLTLNGKLSVLSRAAIGLQWLLFRSGLGATNHFESGAFIRSRAGVEYPDIQYHFLPGAVRYDGRAATPGHGFQVHVGPMRSPSRGHVRARNRDPRSDPEIFFNYMSCDADWRDFRACIRLTREIFAQPAMAPFKGREVQPGDSITSDDEIDDFVRNHCESAFHPTGTCKMGARDDPLAVVDPECKVIGIDGLRVADSSIFPQIPNGNLNGPSLMTGEKAADMILGKPALAPSNLKPWINPHWQTSQR